MVLFIQNVVFVLLVVFLAIGLKTKISSPIIAFILPFAVSSIYLSFNISRWSVELIGKTAFVIIGGCISFLVGTLLVENIYDKCHFSTSNELIINSHSIILRKSRKLKQGELNADNRLLTLFAVVQAVSIGIVFRNILSVSKKYGYEGNISRLIYGYRFLSTYTTENLSLGLIGNTCYNFATAAGFIWIYLLVYNIVKKKKKSVPLIINTLFSIIMCLLKGGREKAMQLVIAGFLYYLFFNAAQRKDGRELSPKQFAIVSVLGLLIAGSFQMLGTVLGRTVQADFMQYIAVYLSGSIRNLDVYLREPWGNSNLFGKMTFIRIINYVGRKIGNNDWMYPLDLPYQVANGKNSGNIYTTFYAYLYDFGYWGIVFMPFFIGVATNTIYKIAKKNVRKINGTISFSLLVYGYWYYTLLFSYFSNKFYEMTFTITFIRNILIWIILIYILRKVHLRKE